MRVVVDAPGVLCTWVSDSEGGRVWSVMKRPHLPANERHRTDPTDPISRESRNGPTRRPQVQKYERGSNPLYFLPLTA